MSESIQEKLLKTRRVYRDDDGDEIVVFGDRIKRRKLNDNDKTEPYLIGYSTFYHVDDNKPAFYINLTFTNKGKGNNKYDAVMVFGVYKDTTTEKLFSDIESRITVTQEQLEKEEEELKQRIEKREKQEKSIWTLFGLTLLPRESTGEFYRRTVGTYKLFVPHGHSVQYSFLKPYPCGIPLDKKKKGNERFIDYIGYYGSATVTIYAKVISDNELASN